MAVPDLQDALDCLQQEDIDGAIATLERKVDELPAHLTAYVLLARAHESKHQWEQALRSWENVYFLMPNSPVAREGKRRVLRRMNREEEAKGIEQAPPSAPTQTGAPSDSEAAMTEDESPDAEPTGTNAATAKPTGEQEPADEQSPAEEAVEDASEDEQTTATEAASELEDLRRRAESEARRGGARPELKDSPAPSNEGPSPSTPEERVDQLKEDGDDLDRLIDELESARIEPNPNLDEVPAPDLDNEVDDIVSETLARIHEAQDKYRKAAQIYVKLASQEPDQAREHLEKAAEMRRKAEGNVSKDDA